MLRTLAMTLATLAASASVAAAQDGTTPPNPSPPPAAAQETSQPVGPGAIEIAAVPAGGMFFTQSATGAEPHVDNYSLGAAVTGNLNRWIGLEGEALWARGLHEDFTFNNSALVNQRTPDMLSYEGGVLISPIGNDHRVAPYLAGGFGGLTLMSTTEVTNLGIAQNQTFMVGNVGAGVKLWVSPHLGVRADYRYMRVFNDTSAPLFFGQEDRNVHRVYAAVVFTY